MSILDICGQLAHARSVHLRPARPQGTIHRRRIVSSASSGLCVLVHCGGLPGFPSSPPEYREANGGEGGDATDDWARDPCFAW